MKFLFSLSFPVIFLCSLSSCNKANDQNISQDIVFDEQEVFTRSTAQKIVSKYYHLNSVAAFERGTSKFDLEQIANLADKDISFVVLYESSAPWASVFSSGKYTETGDVQLNKLLNTYDLSIVEQFEIDDANEGIVLEVNRSIQQPLEAARKLSLVDYVFMVEIKELPANQPSYEETAEK